MVWYDSFTIISTELQFQPIPMAATLATYLRSTLPQAFAQPWGHTSQTRGTPGVRWAARCGWHIGNAIHLSHLRFSSPHWMTDDDGENLHWHCGYLKSSLYFSLLKTMPVPCIADATNKPQAPPAVFFTLMLKMSLATKQASRHQTQKKHRALFLCS